MDKTKCIARVAENDEDRLLFAKIYDKLCGAEQKNIPGTTMFLSPREQVLTGRMLHGMELIFWGGHEDAERKIGCWLPEYLDQEWLTADESPISAVRASYYEKDVLTHRDFLGSLMGSGIKRETVGDIYVGKGSCDFFVTKEVIPYVLQNLVSAGRTKLHVEQIPLDTVRLPVQTVREIRDTVPSLRLDSIVGSGFQMARGKASALIETGKVSLNDLPCIKPDKLLQEGDKVSARGFGKLVLSTVAGKTKKDRISVIITKFV